MKWLPGRQGTGYRKLLLGQGACWDAWILDYPPGHGIPAHVDLLPGRRPLRLNVAILTGKSRLVADAVGFRLGELLVAFWSDRRHRVEPGSGRRVVLSIGISLRDSAGAGKKSADGASVPSADQRATVTRPESR